ncbi:hypothetical protein AMTRI_Chr04g183980 [Amborella trichopoda]
MEGFLCRGHSQYGVLIKSQKKKSIARRSHNSFLFFFKQKEIHPRNYQIIGVHIHSVVCSLQLRSIPDIQIIQLRFLISKLFKSDSHINSTEPKQWSFPKSKNHNMLTWEVP